jgi:proline iminopeptidase
MADLDTYKSGYIDVTDGHSLYYELYGNPEGKPILFLHGGPGEGFEDDDKRFFNPEVWNVIFFDQRGAGRSKPFASLHENNTEKLVEDINTILKTLKIDQVTLFGGSWGTTLALIYAIRNKEKVNGLILRGIYYGNTADMNQMISGSNKDYFPEYWERFIKLVPEDNRDNVVSYYLDQMLNGDEEIRDKYCYEWAYYESASMIMGTTEEKIKEEMEGDAYKSISPIEATYMLNHSFVPDNYILDNAHLLSDLPVTIIHGRYDFVCPPINAWKLHKAIKNSQLYFVNAGHSSSEEEIENKLQVELKRFENI